MIRLLVAGAVALVGCGAAPKCELPPAVASPQPFLWKATRDGAAPLPAVGAPAVAATFSTGVTLREATSCTGVPSGSANHVPSSSARGCGLVLATPSASTRSAIRS